MGHSMISNGCDVVVCGGIDENNVTLNDVWILHFVPGESKNGLLSFSAFWEKVKTNGNFPARARHSAVKWKTKMVVYGGTDLRYCVVIFFIIILVWFCCLSV